MITKNNRKGPTYSEILVRALNISTHKNRIRHDARKVQQDLSKNAMEGYSESRPWTETWPRKKMFIFLPKINSKIYNGA